MMGTHQFIVENFVSPVPAAHSEHPRATRDHYSMGLRGEVRGAPSITPQKTSENLLLLNPSREFLIGGESGENE